MVQLGGGGGYLSLVLLFWGFFASGKIAQLILIPFGDRDYICMAGNRQVCSACRILSDRSLFEFCSVGQIRELKT